MSVSVFADLGPPHAPVFLLKRRQCGMTTYAKLVEQAQREIGVTGVTRSANCARVLNKAMIKIYRDMFRPRGMSQSHWRKVRREQDQRYLDAATDAMIYGAGFVRLRWDENSNRVKVGRIDARQTQTT